jgi:hypothetical protein
MNGQLGGVDLRGNSMNTFLGTKILPELLVMAKVGIYTDMPPLTGPTVADSRGKRPYFYIYRAEDIRAWAYDLPNQPNEFSKLLLYDHLYEYDSELGLPEDIVDRFRYLEKVPEGVLLRFYDDEGKQIDQYGNDSKDDILLNLPKIPFTLIELPVSLIADVADYQVALLNLESTDVNYIRKANFPFYTEQYNARYEGGYQQQPGDADAVNNDATEIKVGVTQGRRYPIGTERPGFINPSAEPLKVSMEKERQIKDDIRLLVNLALTTLNPRMASAESKEMDNQGLESGLSFIGLVLEKGENDIASCWSMYDGEAVSTITYPQDYSLKSEFERQKEVEGKQAITEYVPSDTFKRETAKEIAKIMLRGKISTKTIQKVCQEIDEALTMTSDAATIEMDLNNGLVDLETASRARGYKEGTVEKAKKDHAERVAATLAAQTTPGGSARGVPDLQMGQKTSKAEKVNTPGRGEGK